MSSLIPNSFLTKQLLIKSLRNLHKRLVLSSCRRSIDSFFETVHNFLIKTVQMRENLEVYFLHFALLIRNFYPACIFLEEGVSFIKME